MFMRSSGKLAHKKGQNYHPLVNRGLRDPNIPRHTMECGYREFMRSFRGGDNFKVFERDIGTRSNWDAKQLGRSKHGTKPTSVPRDGFKSDQNVIVACKFIPLALACALTDQTQTSRVSEASLLLVIQRPVQELPLVQMQVGRASRDSQHG